MAQQLYKVSAPGSLMLMGEHAVLANKQALVCAINKRLTVSLIPNTSNKIEITDAKLGTITQDIDDIQIVEPFKFVLSAISLFKNKLKNGFSLKIDAEFSSTIGFGSSAAVTAATVAVLAYYLNNRRLSEEKIFNLAKKAVLQIQGIGSGADLAASIYGGVVLYQIRPLKVQKLAAIPSLTAVYSGYKKPTVEVVNLVKAAKEKQPKLYADIFNAMQTCVERAVKAIKQADWATLGNLFKVHHGLQCALGVSDSTLDGLAHQLSALPQILGAKISGSGLGDCVIGLGTITKDVFAWQMSISVDKQGLMYADH